MIAFRDVFLIFFQNRPHLWKYSGKIGVLSAFREGFPIDFHFGADLWKNTGKALSEFWKSTVARHEAECPTIPIHLKRQKRSSKRMFSLRAPVLLLIQFLCLGVIHRRIFLPDRHLLLRCRSLRGGLRRRYSSGLGRSCRSCCLCGFFRLCSFRNIG